MKIKYFTNKTRDHKIINFKKVFRNFFCFQYIEMFGNNIVLKSSTLYEKGFYCNHCDYNTVRKSQMDRHMNTEKHKRKLMETKSSKYECISCNKLFKTNSGLWKHKKKCKYIEDDETENENNENNEILKTENDNIDYKSMFLKMITDNKELRDTLITENKELLNKISELIPMVGNNNNSHNNIKQKFNINVFLNEQCKDALTMNEFIDKIKITMDDLMITKNKGIAEGVSNIFIENMNKLSLHERPIHCTDIKRETMYIKCEDDNQDGKTGPHWEKDLENKKIKKALEKVSHVQNRGLIKWVEKHPKWEDIPDQQEEYMLLINKCTSDLMSEKREDKIIKKLCNEVYVKGD